MSVNNEVLYVRDNMHELEGKDLSLAVATFSDVPKLIIALLGSLGYENVFCDQAGSKLSYYSMIHSQREDLVVYDASRRCVSGVAVSDLAAALSVVQAIEGRLSEALYFPPNVRKKLIDAVILDAGVDEKFYKKILAGWKVFR